MTDTTVTVHGLDFSVTGDGFRNARDDFDRIADRIADKLYDMDPELLRGLHAGAMMDDETGEAPDQGAVELLESIAVDETQRIIARWAKTEGIYVTVYPV